MLSVRVEKNAKKYVKNVLWYRNHVKKTKKKVNAFYALTCGILPADFNLQ